MSSTASLSATVSRLVCAGLLLAALASGCGKDKKAQPKPDPAAETQTETEATGNDNAQPTTPMGKARNVENVIEDRKEANDQTMPE